MDAPANLNGFRILVTRPEGRAESLCRLLEHNGGVPIRFPTIEIKPSTSLLDARARLQNASGFDWFIFISVNAVQFAMQVCENNLEIEAGLRVAAIGEATAQALKAHGIEVDLVPTRQFGSDAFLSSRELQSVGGCHFLIVRGEGGRELIADTLIERGATVSYAEVYRRCMPIIDAPENLRNWSEKGIDAVIVTSVESLRNLFAMIGNQGYKFLKNKPFIVVSPRIAEYAGRSGIQNTHLAEDVTDASIFNAICSLLQ